MALSEFLLEIKRQAVAVAAQYGLDPRELELTMITAAYLEGGLGETANTGDGGYSVGRYQFHTNGGHGSTLLNQGYTLEEIADDIFQAKHWTPLMAQSLANVKARGLNGGDAVRQAIFELEKPYEMYPARRFNDGISLAQEHVGGEGAGGVTDMAGDYDAGRAEKERRYNEALAKFEAMDPEDEDYYVQKERVSNAYSALMEHDDIYGTGPKGSGKDPAQQGFDNAISLGDFELRKADSAFARWYDKHTLAKNAAEGQVKDTRERNAEIAEMNANIEGSQMPNLQPRPTVARYVDGPYQDVLAKWKREYGATGEAPGVAASGIGLPGRGTGPGVSAPATGSGATGGGRAFSLLGEPETPEYETTFGQDLMGGPLRDVASLVKAYGQPRERSTGIAGDTHRADSGADRSAGRTFAPFPMPSASDVKKKARRWWQKAPRFAEGVKGFEGGPAMVGEQGLEYVDIPGVGRIRVDQAQMMDLPAGSDVIPADEEYLMSRIKQAAREGPAMDKQRQAAGAEERQADPNLRATVEEEVRRALAAMMAMDPPPTPMLGEGVRDMWAELRPLSGQPATAQPAGVQ